MNELNKSLIIGSIIGNILAVTGLFNVHWYDYAINFFMFGIGIFFWKDEDNVKEKEGEK